MMGKTYFNLLPLLKKKKEITFLAKTGSMAPLILPKDKVVVNTISIQKIKPNEIIAYYHKKIDKIVVHRVVNIEPDKQSPKLTTKADISNLKDKIEIKKNNYLGKVVTIKKESKTISLKRNSFTWLKYNPKVKNYRKILNKVFKLLFF